MSLHYDDVKSYVRRIDAVLAEHNYSALGDAEMWAAWFERVAECLEELDYRVQSAPHPVLQAHAEQPDTCNDMDAKDMADAREEIWHGQEYWSRR